jgi:serine/threonine protein kinase
VRPLRQTDPRSFGRYRLLARIGSGGMAIVYFGRSVGGRAVAVKAVHGELADDPAYRDRFRREVAATRAAGGRYSPAVADADPGAAIPWLAVEFLPGVSLREAVSRHGPLTTTAAWSLAAGVVAALAAVHEAGVVHLDLKPANVLLTADGPKLIDFGIAAVGQPSATPATPAGSPGFGSPEQVAGGQVGPASDVYSLGATLAYAVTGTAPGATPPDIPDRQLREVITACRTADPAARPTVPELAAYLSAGASGGDWLPPAVAAEISRRAEEAAGLSVATRPEPAPRLNRRTLLLSGVAVVAAGAAVGLPIALRDNRSVPGAAAPGTTVATTTTTTSPSFAPIDTPKTKPMQVVLTGTLLLHSMTLTVNGTVVQALTNLQLPWTFYADVPAEGTVTWRIDYHGPAGEFGWSVGVADAWLDPGERTLPAADNVGYVTGTH